MREEAAMLILRLHRKRTHRNRKACVRFYRRSPAHMRVFLDTFLSIYGVQALAASGFHELRAAPEAPSRRSFLMPVLGRAALAGACAAVVAVLFMPFIFPHLLASNGAGEGPGNRVCTQIGEVRSLSLDDGSRIDLTTNSCVELPVSDAKRVVRLLQGEAVFTVRHNDARPFTVLTPDVAIQDVGTQFRVFLHEDHTDVDVLEGKVRVSALSTPPSLDSPPANLGPGEEATVVGSSSAVTITTEKLPPGTLERALAWREGQLEFRDDRLTHAVSEINRYNTRQLRIVDPAIENLLVGGRFRYSDVDGAIAALTHVLPIRASVDESNPSLINLSSLRSTSEGHHQRHKRTQQPAPQ